MIISDAYIGKLFLYELKNSINLENKYMVSAMMNKENWHLFILLSIVPSNKQSYIQLCDVHSNLKLCTSKYSINTLYVIRF